MRLGGESKETGEVTACQAYLVVFLRSGNPVREFSATS